VIGVRVSEEEMAILEENSDGQDLSGFLRRAGLGEERAGKIPRANREIAGQLARIGNNVNQLVRLAHTGRFPPYLEPVLKRVFQELARYRRELLGRPR